MAFLFFLVVLIVVGVVVWRRRAEASTGSGGPAQPPGWGASLVDQGRDLLAPLFPSKPLPRRALPRRLLRAAEQTVTVGVSGVVLVPTRIRIAVNPADLEPFNDALEWLRRDLAEALRQKANDNGWMVPRGPEIEIVADEDRPVRSPRATGRIDAYRPDESPTPGLPPPPAGGDGDGAGGDGDGAGAGAGGATALHPDLAGPAAGGPGSLGGAGGPATVADADAAGAGAGANPELTGRTSVVGAVGEPELNWGGDNPTEPLDPTIHVRLLATDEHPGTGPSDLNALLVASAPPLVMGRSREADLQIRDRQASGRHCTLSVDPAQLTVVVRDLQSTNGTFVDDNRIDEATLVTGSMLRLGTASWRVELSPVGANPS
jgi:hypothetical protein